MAPHDPDLLDALEDSRIDRVEGVVWRQVFEPTAVLRANLRGGRWNPPGVEALYASLDPDTVAAEIQYLSDQQPVPITRQRTTHSLKVRLSGVADLLAAPMGPAFGYSYDPTDADTCAEIGAAAAWLRLAGLIVPSVRATGANLVVFTLNLGADDYLDPADHYPYPPGPPPEAVVATDILRVV